MRPTLDSVGTRGGTRKLPLITVGLRVGTPIQMTKSEPLPEFSTTVMIPYDDGVI